MYHGRIFNSVCMSIPAQSLNQPIPSVSQRMKIFYNLRSRKNPEIIFTNN